MGLTVDLFTSCTPAKRIPLFSCIIVLDSSSTIVLIVLKEEGQSRYFVERVKEFVNEIFTVLSYVERSRSIDSLVVWYGLQS